MAQVGFVCGGDSYHLCWLGTHSWTTGLELHVAIVGI